MQNLVSDEIQPLEWTPFHPCRHVQRIIIHAFSRLLSVHYSCKCLYSDGNLFSVTMVALYRGNRHACQDSLKALFSSGTECEIHLSKI